MATTQTPSFRWSDLARESTAVGAALDAHGAVLVSRGKETLRLAPSGERPIQEAMRDLCRLLSAVVAHDRSHIPVILNAAWPWTLALPPEDQMSLAEEVGPLAEMSESLDDWGPLLNALADWKRTARAYLNGGHPVVIDEPLGAEAARPA